MLIYLTALLIASAVQTSDAPHPAKRAQAIPTGPDFTERDYPASALKNREEGTVGFDIIVGVNGRISDSRIVKSSGSAALDEATCLLISRARFKSARDADGIPTEDVISREMTWQLP